MPLIAADQALSVRPRRILVAGTSGSGKTSLAARIAGRLDIPHVEIDELFHGPGWEPRPEFVADVHRLIARPAWVTEWQYTPVRPALAAAADLMVWLDLPRATVLRQVTRRTLRRRLGRQRLWNGNIEPPLWTFFTDDEHIVRWAWRTHPETARRIETLVSERPELPVVRLDSHAAARQWLDGPLAVAASTG